MKKLALEAMTTNLTRIYRHGSRTYFDLPVETTEEDVRRVFRCYPDFGLLLDCNGRRCFAMNQGIAPYQFVVGMNDYFGLNLLILTVRS
jgi:hypothetical protein